MGLKQSIHVSPSSYSEPIVFRLPVIYVATTVGVLISMLK